VFLWTGIKCPNTIRKVQNVYCVYGKILCSVMHYTAIHMCVCVCACACVCVCVCGAGFIYTYLLCVCGAGFIYTYLLCVCVYGTGFIYTYLLTSIVLVFYFKTFRRLNYCLHPEVKSLLSLTQSTELVPSAPPPFQSPDLRTFNPGNLPFK
jgi:hypothetical protein